MKIVDGVNYTNWSRTHFEHLKKANISLVHVSVVYWEDTPETISVFEKWDAYFEDNKDLILKIEKASDIKKADAEGKCGIIIGWQNSAPINTDLELLTYFFERGLRVMQLTYNNQSYLASGCYELHDAKITRFGKEVIQEMNRLGIAIDLSHIRNESGLEAVALSHKPVCVSHSIPTFSKNSERNISEELMQAVAGSGGILGLSLYPLHIGQGSACTLDEYCELILRSVDIMGIDHVGIGSDLCTDHPNSVLQWMRCGKWMKKENYTDTYYTEPVWPKPMSWFSKIGDFHNLIEGLKSYGFDSTSIEKIMGLNWIRFMKAILPE